MPIQPVILGSGLDLVRSKQEADPGSLSDCLNFEIANRRGLTKIQGIKAFSGGVGNDVIDPYILHSVSEAEGVNLENVTGTFTTGTEGWIVKWGSGGYFDTKKGTLTTVDGYASVCFSRRISTTRIVLALHDINGRLPAPGDLIVSDVYTITARVFDVPILASQVVEGSISIFGSYTTNVDGALQLIHDFDMNPTPTSTTPFPLPVNPLGSIRGGFMFRDEQYVIGDIETWAFTSGSEEPTVGDSFFIYYIGTAFTGSARSYVVEKVVTESGDWSAGTAAGKIWLLMDINTAAKGSVISATDCGNDTTTTANPMTLTGLVRAQAGAMWKSVGQKLSTGSAGAPWVRQDLGYEIRFNTGNRFPTVLNRSNRDVALEASVTTTADTYAGTAAGWTNSSNANADDGSVATQPNDGVVRPPLRCTNFGFSIPSTAVILGVEVEIDRRKEHTTAVRARDRLVQLVGVPGVSQDKKRADIWPTALATVSYGSATDLWGTSLTPEIVNSSTFGVEIAAEAVNGSGGADRQIDFVRMSITYKDRSSVVYFWDGTTDVSTGRVIWYHKDKGAWDTGSPTAEGTLTVYELSDPTAIRTGLTIRTLPAGSGNLIATVGSAAERVYMAPSNALDTNASQYEITEEVNFFGSRGTEQVFVASGADFAGSWDGTYYIRIRTGIDANQDKPRHVTKMGDQLVLGYQQGVCMASDLGYPESYAGVVGGTLGGSSPISDDTTTYLFAGGAQEVLLGDSVYGFLPLSQQSLGVYCRNSIRQIVGSGGALVQNLISNSAGIIEYTARDVGTAIHCDYRGIGTITATDTFGDFARGRLSDFVSPWLLPRLQQTGASFLSNTGPIRAEVVRNKNQYRLYFRDGYVLTMTMVGNDFSNPEFTIQKLPFVPATTFTGVSSGGKDYLFMAPYGMAELGAFSNTLRAEYILDTNYVPDANLYAPAFLYQGDVGTSWDGKLQIESYVEINSGAGREWQDKHFDRMVVGGQSYGYGSFGVNYGVDFGDVENGAATNINSGSLAATANKAFSIQTFSVPVDVMRDGYAITIRFQSNNSLLYGATTAQTAPYKFRPVTLQSIILLTETLKTRRS